MPASLLASMTTVAAQFSRFRCDDDYFLGLPYVTAFRRRPHTYAHYATERFTVDGASLRGLLAAAPISWADEEHIFSARRCQKVRTTGVFMRSLQLSSAASTLLIAIYLGFTDFSKVGRHDRGQATMYITFLKISGE